jgi:hypothetical protein
MKMFYDDFEVGDTLGYDEIWEGRKTGRVIEKVLTEQILSDIKTWEKKENEHNMRIIKKKKDYDNIHGQNN